VDARRYVLENFAAVMETEEYNELSLARLTSYVESDLVEVREEEVLWHAVLQWIEADKERRNVDACLLMAQLRFRYMCPEFVEQYVVSHELIKLCSTCSKLVALARRDILASSSVDSGTPGDLAEDLSQVNISQEVRLITIL